ncbi:MAG: hypothetical protein METHSR3v1_2010008 [Methanothrix sp.]|nr:MAG: hypothetical protein METHSR3v1_2010008 [Methanothrix sp.]
MYSTAEYLTTIPAQVLTCQKSIRERMQANK